MSTPGRHPSLAVPPASADGGSGTRNGRDEPPHHGKTVFHTGENNTCESLKSVIIKKYFIMRLENYNTAGISIT